MRGFLNFVQAKQHLPYLQNLNALKLSISLSSIFVSCKDFDCNRSKIKDPYSKHASDHTNGNSSESIKDSDPKSGVIESNLNDQSKLETQSVTPDDSVSNVSVTKKCVAFINTLPSNDVPDQSTLLASPHGLQTELAQPPRDKKKKRDRAAVSSSGPTVISKASKTQESSSCHGSGLADYRLSSETVRAVKDFFSQNQVLKETPPNVKIKCRRIVRLIALLRNSYDSSGYFDQHELDAICILGGSMWLCCDGPAEFTVAQNSLVLWLKQSWMYSVKEHGWFAQLNFVTTAVSTSCIKTKRNCSCP